MGFVVSQQPAFLEAAVVLEIAGDPAPGQTGVQRHPGFNRKLPRREVGGLDVWDVNAVRFAVEGQRGEGSLRQAYFSLNRAVVLSCPIDHRHPFDLVGIKRPPAQWLGGGMAADCQQKDQGRQKHARRT